ncbi:Hypothetical protein NTJ_03405 [Nesidiocoris tenuis]|uniref:Uncharacterized protein n=1 Tax=Nesidiocoris tenuis TaxID=355587 RepID=A0ABN7AE88_9HEMI|nr:Hypothetical protein NTJ_03405 [Nesidiocoris tenuis]
MRRKKRQTTEGQERKKRPIIERVEKGELRRTSRGFEGNGRGTKLGTTQVRFIPRANRTIGRWFLILEGERKRPAVLQCGVFISAGGGGKGVKGSEGSSPVTCCSATAGGSKTSRTLGRGNVTDFAHAPTEQRELQKLSLWWWARGQQLIKEPSDEPPPPAPSRPPPAPSRPHRPQGQSSPVGHLSPLPSFSLCLSLKFSFPPSIPLSDTNSTVKGAWRKRSEERAGERERRPLVFTRHEKREGQAERKGEGEGRWMEGEEGRARLRGRGVLFKMSKLANPQGCAEFLLIMLAENSGHAGFLVEPGPNEPSPTVPENNWKNYEREQPVPVRDERVACCLPMGGALRGHASPIWSIAPRPPLLFGYLLGLFGLLFTTLFLSSSIRSFA